MVFGSVVFDFFRVRFFARDWGQLSSLSLTHFQRCYRGQGGIAGSRRRDNGFEVKRLGGEEGGHLNCWLKYPGRWLCEVKRMGGKGEFYCWLRYPGPNPLIKQHCKLFLIDNSEPS